jgi:hypothetical protein
VPENVIDPYAFVGDQYWGQGGSFTVDPETGLRVPVVQTLPAPEPIIFE